MYLENSNTPDISTSETYIINNDLTITNFLNGEPDDIRYFIFGTNAVIESNTDIKLQGGVDLSGNIGDTITIIYDGSTWLEISRSLNPMYDGGKLSDYMMDISYIVNDLESLRASITAMQRQVQLFSTISDTLTLEFEPTMTYVDIQNEINNLYKHVTNNADVNLVFKAGEYILSSPLVMRNFRGDGTFHIKTEVADSFSTSKNVILNTKAVNCSVFQFVNCDIPIYFNGFEIETDISDAASIYNGAVEIVNSDKLQINYNYFNSESIVKDNIHFDNSTGLVAFNYFKNGNSCVHATNLSRMSLSENSVTGTNPNYGIVSSNGSTISLIDSQNLQGNISDSHTYGGGKINS